MYSVAQGGRQTTIHQLTIDDMKMRLAEGRNQWLNIIQMFFEVSVFKRNVLMYKILHR